jgi:tRNA(Ile)-lysidine synthase
VEKLAESVTRYIQRQKLLKAGDRVGVAVSGGADSVALLRLLIELRKELGIVLSLVHFNHKLRGAEADADEFFVKKLAERHGLPIHCASGDVRADAAATGLGIEAAARKLRYGYFKELLAKGTLERVATAHTLDDQAETVLMRVVRGAGTRGLAGIHPAVSISAGGSIVRPLLEVRRKQLEAYLSGIGQPWREDGSNRDLRYARNRVRHGILPRLERGLNPSVREALATTAEIAHTEQEYWDAEIARLMPGLWDHPSSSLKLDQLRSLSLAVQRRIIQAAAERVGLRLEFQHIEKILELVGADRGGESATLPSGWQACREKQSLRFQSTEQPKPGRLEYSYSLTVPGEVKIPEIGVLIHAVCVSTSEKECDPEQSFTAALLGQDLCVRNWQAGDRFRPAHTKSPKKLKELLTEQHLSGKERQLWPVIASENEIVWVRGFPSPEHLRPKNGTAILIRTTALCESERPE